MMMSKPAPSASEEEEEKTSASATASSATKPQGQGTVADLERRLAMLSTAEEKAAFTDAHPEALQAPPAAAAAVAPPAAKSGKNALLVS
jgi:hypothetical protein